MSTIKTDWENGFDAGYELCKTLLTQPVGTKMPFFPYEKGNAFCCGFAEGTITGRSDLKVSYKFTAMCSNEIEKI